MGGIAPSLDDLGEREGLGGQWRAMPLALCQCVLCWEREDTKLLLSLTTPEWRIIMYRRQYHLQDSSSKYPYRVTTGVYEK